MSDALAMSVMDTLLDVTMDTIFDAAERFDALVRDLVVMVREQPEGATAATIHEALSAAPLAEKILPRRAVMIQFFWNLPAALTQREIVAGLEGR